MLRCPACKAERDVWCHSIGYGDDPPICDARKALYNEVYDRYIHGVQNHNIPLYEPDADKKQRIEKIIQEVEAENGIYPRVHGCYDLKAWIDDYYEDISVSELVQDLETSWKAAKSILNSLEAEGFVVSPVYNNKDRYKVVHKIEREEE